MKPCLDCGRLSAGSRCPEHTRQRARTRPTPTQATRTTAERARRAAAVAAHRAEHGDWCPGWGVPPHPVVAPNVLTADHSTAVGAGGSQAGPLTVLCRICNGRKTDVV